MYTLMHKNHPVAHFGIHDTFPIIDKVYEIIDFDRLPPGTKQSNIRLDLKRFNNWFFGRAIPKSRNGLQTALNMLNIESSEKLLLGSHGLSLTDQYWFREMDSKDDWEKINYFNHEFSETIGLALFGHPTTNEVKNLDTPDTTSTGNLKKRWIMRNNKRLLVKSGKGPLYQEPFNEVIASLIMKKLSISHVEYWVEWEKEEPLSLCECFINANTEFISAAYVQNMRKKSNELSLYEHLINIYTENGLENTRENLEKMIVLDYIIGNRDRHLNNFGIVRDADSLKWIAPAPVYDSGAALWNDVGIQVIKRGDEIECMPFQKSHSLQIQLVKSFNWIDFDVLRKVLPEIDVLLAENTYIAAERRKAICSGISNRIEELEKLSKGITQNLKNVRTKYYKESQGRKYHPRDNNYEW